ncbi:hypothetical protein MMC30_007423 [Trapelia coarctata]|nr:hypothetical protein [Trapelia coarctata]
MEIIRRILYVSCYPLYYPRGPRPRSLRAHSRAFLLKLYNPLANLFDPTSRPRRHDRRTRNQRWQTQRTHSAEKKRVLAQRPQPLPRSRFNISQPSLPTHGPSPPSPPFLSKLPLEIRLRIYEYILGNTRLHLFHPDPATAPFPLRYLRCHEPTCLTSSCTPLTACPADTAQNQWRRIIAPPTHPDAMDLALLRTCRQIYAEAVDILYGSNIFHISDLNVLVYLANYRIRPQRLRAIRKLELRWNYYCDPAMWRGCVHEPYDWGTWEEVWEIIGARMALSGLKVRLAYWGPGEDLSVDARWIAPMLKVRGIRDVEVAVEWRTPPFDMIMVESLAEQLREVMMRTT